MHDNATCDVNVIGEQKPINKDVIKLTILDKVGGTAISNPIDLRGSCWLQLRRFHKHPS